MESDGDDFSDKHLVTSEWLRERLSEPGIRIADMRGIVRVKSEAERIQTASYEGARHAYLASHIPGAVYLDWTEDLVDLDDPVPAQIAPEQKIARVFSDAGIADDTLVVAYDDHPASQFATRLWWALKYYGHDAVRVLDGGWSRWLAQGLPTASGEEKPASAVFTPHVRPGWRRTAEQVLKIVSEGGETLVDARDGDQYSGMVRRGLHGGHIPGAVHLPREALFGSDGRYLPKDELKNATLHRGLSPERPVTAYCNGGVASTSVLFALSMLGFERLANYDGSWNEWGNREDLPVVTEPAVTFANQD